MAWTSKVCLIQISVLYPQLPAWQFDARPARAASEREHVIYKNMQSYLRQ
jgi:hypothetical protein